MAFFLSFVPLFLLANVFLVGTNAQTDCTAKQIDLAFLVDSSGSICGDAPGVITTCDDWKACVAFIRSIVSDMTIGENDIRVALVIFETSVFPQWDLSTYDSKAALLTAIDNLKYRGGNTNTIAALDYLSTVFRADRGDRPGIPNEVILITDGKPRNGRNPYPMDQIQAAVKRVTDQNIKLFAVGVTNDIDMETLTNLSSTPHKKDETVFVAKDYQSLQMIKKQLENQTCTKPAAAVAQIILEPKPDCNTYKMDLVFLVDSSGSICDNKPVQTCPAWDACRGFIHAIVDDMIIGENDVRVALTRFQTSVFKEWPLSKYYNKAELLKAIDTLHYGGGTTNTPVALDSLSTSFRAENGDRAGVRNVVILISDGKPQIDYDPIPLSVVRASTKRVTDQGVQLFAVGVTDSIDMDTLKEMSSPPNTINGTVFHVKDYQSLQKVLKQLEVQTCTSK